MDDKCRLCGSSDQNLVSVLENNRQFTNLNLRICVSLQIKISTTDQLSHVICQLCYDKLKEFDDYVKLCQKNQFLLSDIDKMVFVPDEEQISTIDLECVALCTDDLSLQIVNPLYDSCDNLIEENEHKMPFKRRKLSPVHLNDEAILVKNEEIEIDLDEYENDVSKENIYDDSSRISPSKNIPFSKLVSFFSSKVKVNNFVSMNGDFSLKLNHNIDENIEVNTDLADTENNRIITQIKCEEIESENTSVTNDSCSDEPETIPNELDIKKENETTNKHNKLKSSAKISKSKSSNIRTCPLCAHQFPPNEIEEHVRFHSDDQEYMDLVIAEMKEVPFKHKMHFCEECKKVFVRDSLFLEHRREHLKIKMINCHLCDHTFSIRKKLKVHLRAVHIPKNSKCDLCSYAAKTYADLQKHIKGVHEFQPIICEICGKSVSCNMSNYNRHLQTHSEEKPYKCELCVSSYKTAASLQKHRANIHFPKSVMCTACGTICGSQIKYKKHVRRCRKRMLRYS